jgi:hypothetical protein
MRSILIFDECMAAIKLHANGNGMTEGIVSIALVGTCHKRWR